MKKWPLRTGLWCPSRLGRMNWSSNERGNTEKWIREVGVRSLERTITGVVMFKAVQSAEWEEKHESDGYVPLSEELELSSSSSTTMMYIQIVRPSDQETILVSHQILPTPSNSFDSFTFSDRDSDQCPREGGISALSWGWCYMAWEPVVNDVSICWVLESFSDLWLFCMCLLGQSRNCVFIEYLFYCHRQEIFSNREQLLHQKYNYHGKSTA